MFSLLHFNGRFDSTEISGVLNLFFKSWCLQICNGFGKDVALRLTIMHSGVIADMQIAATKMLYSLILVTKTNLHAEMRVDSRNFHT